MSSKQNEFYPQDNYAQIPNDLILAAAKTSFPGRAGKVFWAIISKTLMFHKIWDEVALSQICAITGLKRNAACVAVKTLEDMNVIIKRQRGSLKNGTMPPNYYSINRTYSQWRGSPKTGDSPKNDNRVVPKMRHTKDTLTKDKRLYVEHSDECRLAALLHSEIKKNLPTVKQPNLQKWAREIDLMIRIDKRNPKHIERVIRWCQADKRSVDNTKDFKGWHAVILSTAKLRMKFDVLTAQMPAGYNPEQGKADRLIRDLQRAYDDLKHAVGVLTCGNPNIPAADIERAQKRKAIEERRIMGIEKELKRIGG